MKKLPKAYCYIAYLKVKGIKRYLGNVEATNPKQAKERILKQWRNVTTDLDKQVAEGKAKILVFRQRETFNYYKGDKNNV